MFDILRKILIPEKKFTKTNCEKLKPALVIGLYKTQFERF